MLFLKKKLKMRLLATLYFFIVLSALIVISGYLFLVGSQGFELTLIINSIVSLLIFRIYSKSISRNIINTYISVLLLLSFWLPL